MPSIIIKREENNYKAYDADNSNLEITEASKLLNELAVQSAETFLYPDFEENIESQNDFMQEQSKNDNQLTTEFLISDDDIPEDVKNKGLIINRKVIDITVSKDENNKIIYENEEGEIITDLADFLKDKGETSIGERKITINQPVFTLNGVNKDEINIEPYLDASSYSNTFQHELQHIANAQNISAAFKGEQPRISIADQYRLHVYDEVSANLRTILADIKKGSKSSELQWFYDACQNQSFDLANLSSEQLETIFDITLQHWNKEIAKDYVNNEILRNLQEEIAYNPFTSQAQSDSEDYKKALKAILNIKVGDKEFNFAEFDVADNGLDPVKAQQQLRVNQNEDYLTQLQQEANDKCQKMADFGITEDMLEQLRKGEEINEATSPYEHQPIVDETPIDEQNRQQYQDFFRQICNDNNENKYRNYDLKYDEDSNSPAYSVYLSRQKNGETISTTHITINNTHSITMSATNSLGEKVVPEQDRFDDIAKLALQRKSPISFGDISSPEYAARLYLACLKYGVTATNAPDIKSLQANISPRTLEAINAIEANKQPTQTDINAHIARVRANVKDKTEGHIKESSEYYKFCNDYDKNNLQQYAEEHHLTIIKTGEGDKTTLKVVGNIAAQRQYIVERRQAYIKSLSNDHNYTHPEPKDMEKNNFYHQIKKIRESQGSR